MKEFPHRHFAIVEKLQQTPTSSTYVVKPHNGKADSLVLKLYGGTSVRAKLGQLEEELRWQSGLVHPHILGITTAGISGRYSLFTARPFIKERVVVSNLNPSHITHLLNAIRFL